MKPTKDANAVASSALVRRIRDEADLCRNETATDIADLLDEAADALEQSKERAAIIAERYPTRTMAGELDRWEVQQRCPLKGWQTWVIYDEQRHAETECARRIGESALRDKHNWRVVKRSNDQAQPRAKTTG